MKRLIILIFFTLSIKVYSQDIYNPGFIIKTNGDTVTGFLLDDVPMYNSQFCSFKKTAGSDPEQYKPGEILAYRFYDGKYYVSREIKIDTATTKVFLQWLVFGKISIYSYLATSTKIKYFAETDDKKLVELKNTETDVVDKYNDKYRILKKEYIGILNYLTKDCSDVAPLISRSKLNDKSLINVAKKYTEKVCKDRECVIFEKPKKKNAIILSFVTGTNVVKNRLDEIGLFKNNTFSETSSILVGLNLSLSEFDYVSRRLSFETGMYFYKYKIKINSRIDPEAIINFGHIPIIFDYSLLMGTIQPYLSAGGEIIFKLNKTNNNSYLKPFSSPSINPVIGLGLKYVTSKNFVIQASTSYEKTNRYLYPWQNYFGQIYCVQLKFGYSF